MTHIDVTPEEAKKMLEWYEAFPLPTSELEDGIIAKLYEAEAPEPSFMVKLTVSDMERIMRWYGESTDLEDDEDQLQDDNLLTMLSVARKLAE